MKLSKIALATAALAAFASGSVFSGQIGSSSVTVASEVIVTDTQIIRAPSNNYAFAGNIDAQTNQQLLQLQYTLSAGTWSTTVFPAVNTTVTLPINTMLRVNYLDGANANQVTFPANTITQGFVTADRKTLVFNVTIPVAATNLLKIPSFTINALALAGTDNAGISGLFTVVGATTCFAPDKNIDISFKHFTTHNGNTDVIANASPDAEHLRTGSTNSARFMNFVQNQIFSFTPASRVSGTDAAFLNQRLNGSNFTAAAGTAGPGGTNSFAAPAVAVAAPVTRHYFGRINLIQRANGLDLDYINTYGRNGPVGGPAPATVPLQAAADFSSVAAAAVNTGAVELLATSGFTINFPTPLPVGTIIRAADGAGVAIAGAGPITITAANASQVVIQGTGAALIQQAGLANGSTAGPATPVGGVHIWADFPGTGVISGMSGVTVSAALNKAPAGAGFNEQSLTCPGTLTGIGGGIKIDIRNYASRAKYPTGNYTSIVRLINNSEATTADITAQMIYADGTYGPYGVLPALAPRAVANYTNAQLEALLNTTPAATNPFGAGTVYTQTAGASVVGTGSPTAPGVGDRIRFVSNNGTTLRVQSYLALPNGSVLDTTNAQGVDFENTSNNRTPNNVNGVGTDGQPISQDAINGLAR